MEFLAIVLRVAVPGLGYGTLLAIMYAVVRMIYNVTLHPLARFPGPLSHRATVLPRLYFLHTGTVHERVGDLHRRYGSVVRIAPNELAFTDPAAWKDIYGRKPSGAELEMQAEFYILSYSKKDHRSILGAEKTEHDGLRKALAPSFAPSALRAQEPIIARYADMLIAGLRSRCNDGEQALDMTAWLNFFTFDVLGALAFSSDYGCLAGGDYHPWVRLIMGSMKNMAVIQILDALGLKGIFMWAIDKFNVGLEARRLHRQFTESKVKQRLEMQSDMKQQGQSDFLSGLIEMGSSWDTLFQNSGLLVVAGSETTATLMSGALYLLTTQPAALDRLTHEVRSRFRDESEITLSSVNSLDFMLACLNESLRCYPPTPMTAPRSVVAGATTIAGIHVPKDTVVGVWQWATYRSPELFARPNEFLPERWEGKDARFANDRLDAVQPFIVGPRDCVGRNLAYAEMRLVLAKLVWNFDMRLAEDSKNWLDGQKAHFLWDKPALNVHLSPVVR